MNSKVTLCFLVLVLSYPLCEESFVKSLSGAEFLSVTEKAFIVRVTGEQGLHPESRLWLRFKQQNHWLK